MFKPEKMYRARLFLPKRKAPGLIAELHEAGICQLKEAEAELEKEASAEAQKLEELALQLDELIQHLDEFKHITQPENIVKQLFFPEKPGKAEKFRESSAQLVKMVEGTLGKTKERFFEQYRKFKQLQKQMRENKSLMETLEMLPNVATDIFQETDNISVFLGLMNKGGLAKIQSELGKKAAFGIKEVDEKNLLLAVFAKQAEKEEIAKLLHEAGFVVLHVPYSKRKTRELISDYREQNLKLNKRARAIRESLTKMWEQYNEQISFQRKELAVFFERAKAIEKLGASNSFVLLEAWLPAKNLEKFKKLVENSSEQYYFDVDERDDAPALLKNPAIIKPFEMITGLYSMPKYRHFDPTPVLAFSFALFFGFMLTDFFYGVFLAGLAFLVFRGIGKYDSDLRQFALLLIIAGIFTAVLGAAFGSYFGDFFQRQGIEMPMLLDPMKQTMIVIGISVVLGTLHLATGLTMGLIENMKLGKVQEALAKQGVWLFFLIGVALLLLGDIFLLVGGGLILLAVIMQVTFSLKESGAVVGILSVFDFSGFVGDVFSYTRLTALAVGTAGIALAVNFMAELAVEMIPVIGLPIAIIVFLVGHLMNIIMNGLGSFIHTLRLHFLEFFQKFYSGGGTAYQPFHAVRK